MESSVGLTDSGRMKEAQSRLSQLLHVYLLVFFVFSVLPLDLTISVVEIYHKWNEGRLVLLPFGGLKGNVFENLLRNYHRSAGLGSCWCFFGT